MTAPAPDWPHKMLALQEAIHWAARRAATVVFRDSSAASAARASGRPWITLAMDRISTIGDDELYTIPDPSNAGQLIEVPLGRRNFTIEVRAYSREQRLAEQAWYIADTVRTRMRRSAYAAAQWLEPNDIAIVAMRDVVNLSPRNWDGRAEGEAVLELDLSTIVSDVDVSNATTWIDTVLLSSTLTGLADPSLDLVAEPIP